MPDALRREYDIEFEEVRPKGSPQYPAGLYMVEVSPGTT